jgi:hypothetical protein
MSTCPNEQHARGLPYASDCCYGFESKQREELEATFRENARLRAEYLHQKTWIANSYLRMHQERRNSIHKENVAVLETLDQIRLEVETNLAGPDDDLVTQDLINSRKAKFDRLTDLLDKATARDREFRNANLGSRGTEEATNEHRDRASDRYIQLQKMFLECSPQNRTKTEALEAVQTKFNEYAESSTAPAGTKPYRSTKQIRVALSALDDFNSLPSR